MHADHRRNYIYAPAGTTAAGAPRAPGWHRSFLASLTEQPRQQSLRESASGLDRHYYATEEEIRARVAVRSRARGAAPAIDGAVPPTNLGQQQTARQRREWHEPKAAFDPERPALLGRAP